MTTQSATTAPNIVQTRLGTTRHPARAEITLGTYTQILVKGGMVLRDLFRPRWQHSNPVVRRAAVTKLVDQALLAEIAKNDVHRGVRIAAAEKLSDQKVLLSVATGNDLLEVRMAAAKRLTDETIAARVLADLEKDFQTREQAANAFRELAEFRQDHAVKLPARK